MSSANSNQYTFKFKNLEPSKPLNIQKYVRVSLFLKKRPDITHEQFQPHWTHQHADLLVSLKTWPKTGTYRYSQFVQDPELQTVIQQAGLPLVEWDGCAEMWFTSLDDFFAVASDEDYHKALEHMKVFVSEEDGEKVMIGYENLIYGDALPGLGKDGLSKKDLEALS